MSPKVSVVVGAYNMARELPRTMRSLSPAMQVGVERSDYELIVVDNGSTRPFNLEDCRRWGADLDVLTIAPAAAATSPARAMNLGLAKARGELIGAMIDGARIASPGLIAAAREAARNGERAVILTLGFHLGYKVQMESVHEGYDQAREDRLLEDARWTEDGYRLFGISVFAGSSQGGWFKPIRESNALFMRRGLWNELGGFDERFVTPGGGYVNLDLLSRAVALPDVKIITLLGEGTFHQVHGGVATNAVQGIDHLFAAEYAKIRGKAYQAPDYDSRYFGAVPGPL